MDGYFHSMHFVLCSFLLFQHRYIDDVFFTSNESVQTITQLLNEMNHLHPNIKLTSQIDQNIAFLDVQIENHNGILFTAVHHKDAAEPMFYHSSPIIHGIHLLISYMVLFDELFVIHQQSKLSMTNNV